MGKLTIGSAFSGIGGFDLAAERVGMTVAWQIEMNPTAHAVLSVHWPEVPRYGDITTVDPNDLSSVDLLCGGFPCQDLSVAGRRAGLAGARSGLFWEWIRLVDGLRPSWILLENVAGLLSSNDGRDLGTVLRAVGDLGYGWAYRVLDAQWAGVGQLLRRWFLVGCLGDRTRAAQVLLEPEGVPGSAPPRRFPGSHVAATPPAGAAHGRGVSPPERRGEDAIYPIVIEVPEIGCTLLTKLDSGSASMTTYLPVLDYEGAGTPSEHAGGQWVLRVRRLLPVERERIQGFPDDHTRYRADGSELSDSARYRLIGNAVAVPVVEWILRRVAEMEAQ